MSSATAQFNSAFLKLEFLTDANSENKNTETLWPVKDTYRLLDTYLVIN